MIALYLMLNLMQFLTIAVLVIKYLSSALLYEFVDVQILVL